MNEFLTSLSNGQPVVWALFVLGVMAVTALLLSSFWGGVFRMSARFQRGRQRADRDDVLS